MAQSALQYKVLITPLESRNVYGAEIDVTAADSSGSADTLKVTVENTQAATDSIIDASGIETLALTTVNASNTVTLDLTTFEGTAVTVAPKAGVTVAGAHVFGTLHKNTNSLESTI